MQIALAPMEGLVDNILRDVLTRNYPEAVELFIALRRETELDQVSRLLGLQVAAAA